MIHNMMPSWEHRARRVLLVHREIDDSIAEFVTSLNLRNACIAFHDERTSLFRSQIVTQEPIASPMIVHGFSERALGYMRLTSVREVGQYERGALELCQHEPLGLGIPLAHPSSIYHQLFHAVPAWLHLREHLEQAGLASDAPASAFVPLTFASTALGRGKPANPRRWHGWEFSLRPLTRAGPSEIAAATTRLLRAACTCFGTFRASAPPFNPGARTSAAALAGFRAAALRNAAVPPSLGRAVEAPGSSSSSRSGDGDGARAPRALLVSRRGSRRMLSNEAAVWAGLQQLAHGRVQRVVLEEMSLSEQMVLVAGASTLIGVHGQALAWLPFLPWGRERVVSVVEVSLATRQGVINDCYEKWSKALGVQYSRVRGHLTGGCNGGVTSRDNEAERAHKMLSCNVTVDVPQLLGAANAAIVAGGKSPQRSLY